MREFTGWAGARGAAELTVTAYAANEPAQRFYLRHGFTPHSVTLRAQLPPPGPDTGAAATTGG